MIRLRDLPPESRELLARDRRNNRAAADAFYAAVASNDADAFENAMYRLNETMDGWPIALRRIANLPPVGDDVRLRFLIFWIGAGRLQGRADRRTLANALRVLMGGYDGAPLTLYRGTLLREHRNRSYKFAWTASLGIAKKFARDKMSISTELRAVGREAEDAVVLTTTAPAEAILHVRGPELTFSDGGGETLFDEDEIVVDPFRLGPVKVVERLRA